MSLPDAAEIDAIAEELRRMASVLKGYAETGGDPAVLKAAAAHLTHLAVGLIGAGDGTAVTLTFADMNADTPP
jgi:hypothetical protein